MTRSSKSRQESARESRLNKRKAFDIEAVTKKITDRLDNSLSSIAMPNFPPVQKKEPLLTATFVMDRSKLFAPPSMTHSVMEFDKVPHTTAEEPQATTTAPIYEEPDHLAALDDIPSIEFTDTHIMDHGTLPDDTGIWANSIELSSSPTPKEDPKVTEPVQHKPDNTPSTPPIKKEPISTPTPPSETKAKKKKSKPKKQSLNLDKTNLDDIYTKRQSKLDDILNNKKGDLT